MSESRIPEHYGETVKMRLVSNNICFGPPPKPDEEVEQHLTILENGQVFLSRYHYGTGGKYLYQGMERLRVPPEEARRLLNEISRHFLVKGVPFSVTDVGVWELELTDRDGQTVRFEGSLIRDRGKDSQSTLSSLLRDTLKRRNLFVFDGVVEEESVLLLQIEYTKTTGNSKAEDGETPPSPTNEVYKERIVISRENDTITLIRNHSQEDETRLTMPLSDSSTGFFLDEFGEDFFLDLPDTRDEAVVETGSKREYTAVVDFANSGRKTFTGQYDNDGLPRQWADLMELIDEDLQSFHHMDILNPAVYLKRRRRKDDLMFLSVVFQEEGHEYTYLCRDESVLAGDRVLVPVGDGDNTVWAEVVDIHWLPASLSPYPFHKVKTIISKETPQSDSSDTSAPALGKKEHKTGLRSTILLYEPLHNTEMEEVLDKVTTQPTEAVLASALAQVSNKILWYYQQISAAENEKSAALIQEELLPWLSLKNILDKFAATISPEDKGQTETGAEMATAADRLILRHGYVKIGEWWEYQGEGEEIAFFNPASWRVIRDQKGIDRLFQEFDFFDSLVKEMRYDSGAWAMKNGEVNRVNDKRELFMLLQARRGKIPAIEMVFEDLVMLHLAPMPPPHAAGLFGAFMVKENDALVWFDYENFDESYAEMYFKSNVSWVKAKTVRWRVREEFLGKQDIYVTRPETEQEI